MNRTVAFGELVNATFEEVSTNRAIVLIYLAIAVPVDMLASLFDDTKGVDVFGLAVDVALPIADLGVGLLTGFGAFVIAVVLNYWLYAALLARQPAPAFRRFWAYVLVSVLSIIVIVLASLALVIPGIIVAVRWAPLIPALLARDEPAMDSFGESWQMTSGSSWAIFGVAVVVIAVGLFLSLLFDLATAVAGGPGSLGAVFFDAAGGNVMTVLLTALAVATFRSLADRNEEVAAVFE